MDLALGHKKMRSRPATPTAWLRGFQLAGGRFPTALEGIASAAFAKAGRGFSTLQSRICNRYGWPAADPAPRSRMGEEAATPGQPVALARVSGFPPAIHPRESPAAAGSAAIIRQAQELSRFAANTLRHNVSRRNRKPSRRCAKAVDDSISLWKIEENRELNLSARLPLKCRQ